MEGWILDNIYIYIYIHVNLVTFTLEMICSTFWSTEVHLVVRIETRRGYFKHVDIIRLDQ